MSIDYVTVKQEDLTQMLHSESFRKRLNTVALGTVRTGLEYGFGVYRDLEDGTINYTKVIRGKTDQINLRGAPELARLRNACDNGRMHLLLDLHFHPDEYGFPIPSDEDLEELEESIYGLNDRPILTVGQVDRRGRGQLLHLQRRITGDQLGLNAPLMIDLYDRLCEADSALTMMDVVNAIEIPGFAACDYSTFEMTRAKSPCMLDRVPDWEKFAYEARADRHRLGGYP